MLCPTCKKGTLRVIIYAACSCGHHPLICDQCLAHFEVEHGDPQGPLKLPPEHPVFSSPELDEALKEEQSVTDEEFREAAEALPTVDECKELYELLAAHPELFEDDEEEDDEDDNGPN